MKSRAGFALSQVWIVAGIAAGALLLFGPVIAGEICPSDYFTMLAVRFAAYDQLAAACVVAMLVAMLLIAVAFFAASGASIVTIELLQRYILPGLSPREERLGARITLATSTRRPCSCRVLAGGRGGASTLALPLSAQLFPADPGVCWVPWMSCSAAPVGLILGGLFVVFTEPPGLIFFNGLFAGRPGAAGPSQSTRRRGVLPSMLSPACSSRYSRARIET